MLVHAVTVELKEQSGVLEVQEWMQTMHEETLGLVLPASKVLGGKLASGWRLGAAEVVTEMKMDA